MHSRRSAHPLGWGRRPSLPPRASPSRSPPAAAASGEPSRRGSRAEDRPLPPWRRRRLSMQTPEPASQEPPARRRGWWKAPDGRPWPLLAACLTCCTLLGWYTAGSVKDAAGPVKDPAASESPRREEKALRPVTVLVWWEPFGFRLSADCRRQFDIGACSLSTNRSLLAEADAVLVHHRDLQARGVGQLPRHRPPGQPWVWMNLESPSHVGGLRELGGLFNWTMTYRADSDIFMPYGYLRLLPEPLVQLPWPRKTKLLAWVISNWNEGHARVRYYNQLKNYLPIDVYGAHRLALKDNSVRQTISEYKFYLAFENSQHRDYITEKLWRNAFDSWAVPIVLGPPRANYEQFVPSDAFIHVNDFADPMELAVYLKFLDKNKNMYRKHFAWRKQYDVRVPSFWAEHGCRVCNAVREMGKQPKTIRDLAKWFES